VRLAALLGVFVFTICATREVQARPRVTVEYAPSKKDSGARSVPIEIARAVRKVAPALGKALRLPRPLAIKFENCGKENSFYDPARHAIRICHELYESILIGFVISPMTLAKATEMANAAMVFVILHEAAHAVVGELSLPVPGNAEDAADELATILLARLGKPGARAALAAMGFFDTLVTGREMAGRKFDFNDEHSIDEQRKAQIACLLYGSSPATYLPLVAKLGFDKRRKAVCRTDYRTHSRAWNTLLRRATARSN
jgi:hypothetical protein